MKNGTVADRTQALNNLAMLYLLTGRPQKALEAAKRASDLWYSDTTIIPVQRALLLVNLAVIEIVAANAREARQHYEEGMSVAGSVIPLTSPDLANVYATGAKYLRAVGRSREARELTKKAEAVKLTIASQTSIGKTIDYQSFRSNGK
jgi:tetratricopeptide (TPR) repeat protein